jgi:hypothetical protein
MLTDYRVCRSKNCRRSGVLVETANKRCDSCGAKLKYPNDTEQDMLPMVIGDDEINEMLDRDPEGEIVNLNGREYLRLASGKVVPLERMLTAGSKGDKSEESDVWNTGDAALHAKLGTTCNSHVEGCPIMKELPQPTVRIPFDLFHRWVWLARRFNVEWLAYLKGTQAENGDWAITSAYFPRQRAHGAEVRRTHDEDVQEGTIGSVHSHVAMKAFFSGTDKAHFNWPVEVVLNRSSDILAAIAIKLACGRPSYAEGRVVLTDNNMTEENELRSVLTEVEPPSVKGFGGAVRYMGDRPMVKENGVWRTHTQ